MSPDEFLVAMGASIVLCSGLDGQVHVKTRFMMGIVVTEISLSSYVSIALYARTNKTRMWANAQPDGRPAEYRRRPLLNAAVWLTPTTRVPCSNAAKMRNPLKLAGGAPN